MNGDKGFIAGWQNQINISPKLVVLNTALANPLDGTVRYWLSTTGLPGAYAYKAKLAYENLDDIDNSAGGRMDFLLAMQNGDYELACQFFDRYCTAVEISIHDFDNGTSGDSIIPVEITNDIPNQINMLQLEGEDSEIEAVQDSYFQDEEFGGQFQE